MSRAFLVVMDSVGIGGAPDADRFFNGDVPDTGANTVAHIAQACAEGRAEDGRSGPLRLPNLDALGLGAAVRLASGADDAGVGGRADRPVGLRARALAGQGHAVGSLGAGRAAGAMGLALFPRHGPRLP